MSYVCNTEGCSRGDCPNCEAMAAVEALVRALDAEKARADSEAAHTRHAIDMLSQSRREIERLTELAEAFEGDAQAMRALLTKLMDDRPCQYDHSGRCQAHSPYRHPCPHDRARALLSATP